VKNTYREAKRWLNAFNRGFYAFNKATTLGEKICLAAVVAIACGILYEATSSTFIGIADSSKEIGKTPQTLAEEKCGGVRAGEYDADNLFESRYNCLLSYGFVKKPAANSPEMRSMLVAFLNQNKEDPNTRWEVRETPAPPLLVMHTTANNPWRFGVHSKETTCNLLIHTISPDGSLRDFGFADIIIDYPHLNMDCPVR
jgi:hypothetical protein